ncbi:hypothetical protein UA38_20065 [Photobacterium kishitanii]|uniref:Type 1 fimbrial protein n=1 Tax=Photobacterium kishitanii TaxID=318456 RepID=A0AAX0YNZ7_9GAMM|nr:hypothetical protein [Photobacterium kishitanii]KJG55380.1 hypothetical protein UA38_20065 [Photobacterium kishitanii]KJG57987.1 hypothetical protein UA42_20590 [Photobacterium kishitanii]PSX16848.1 hypothetical protein C0W70_22330 [Photobacterium kishitanii]PSX26611.1 hypothetical protein C0W52_17155 [Photobacterium kishitanii]PSX29095.1 hypothetical protein C0W39_21220 [Photobacterium kishitanii]
MKKLILLTILFSSPFSYAGILTFSGSVTAPACKVEIISTQKVTYKNKKDCVPIIKTTEKSIYKRDTNTIKGKIITVSYI